MSIGLGCESCTVNIRQKTYKNTYNSGITKKTLLLKGLNCAESAAMIKKEVDKIKGVHYSFLDCGDKKLLLHICDERGLEITDEVAEIIKKIAPHVEIVEESESEGAALVEDESLNKKELIRIGTGVVLSALALGFEFPFAAEFVLFLASYIIVGGDVVLSALRNISKGHVFDENFLMSVATIGAFAIRQFPEGVAVMLFYKVGEYFQDLAVKRSRSSIIALMNIRPDYANLQVGDDIKTVPPEEVKIGDVILVKPGERVPLDGVVIEGRSMVDTSALTGESVPRDVEEGSSILGGFINLNGLLKLQVTKGFEESTVSKILNLVQDASNKKAPTEHFITKFARYYTPVVVFGALAIALIPPLAIPGASFYQWVYRALVFLVVSCPCALVISIPLGFFAGIGGASRAGILVKGGNYLEALNDVATVVFDKTGTLTKGIFKVTKVVPKNGFSNNELLELAAYAEVFSNHPIAASIKEVCGKVIDKNAVDSYDEILGYGIKTVACGKEILAGNIKLMKKENIPYDEVDIPGTVVHVSSVHYDGVKLMA